VEIRNLDRATPFTTKDGSTIRELLGPRTAPVQNQSLAEATLGPGQATERHYPAASEELYYVVEGSGEMEVDGRRTRVGVGDAILIPPGAWHQLRAPASGRVRILCCCAPPYSDDDTFFA
jgi:mannose-6-phosphate isomerase-like protein (cupin superfamily)